MLQITIFRIKNLKNPLDKTGTLWVEGKCKMFYVYGRVGRIQRFIMRFHEIKFMNSVRGRSNHKRMLSL